MFKPALLCAKSAFAEAILSSSSDLDPEIGQMFLAIKSPCVTGYRGLTATWGGAGPIVLETMSVYVCPR